jgi:hypothetical protein
MLPSIFVALIQLLQSPTDVPKGVDVCTLLSDPLRWNGKFVRVLGQLELGNFEGGPWLSGSKCSTKFKVEDVTFPNVIGLTAPSTKFYQVGFQLHHVDFQWDSTDWDRFNRALHQVDPETERVAVTVVGMFETRDPLSELVRKGRTFGLGPAGDSPVQILVKTIPEIRIVKK